MKTGKHHLNQVFKVNTILVGMAESWAPNKTH